MQTNTSQNQRFDETFKLTSEDRKLFENGRNAQRDFREINGTSLGLAGAQSLSMSCTLGPIKLTSVAVHGYDPKVLALCEQALAGLQGLKRSEILFVIERPPRIVIDGCEDTLVERLVARIGARAGIRVVDPESSLGSVNVIKRAAELAKEKSIPLDEILGATVNATAHPLNIALRVDFASGIDKLVNLLRDDIDRGDIDLVEVYRTMVSTIHFSPDQVREFGKKIDQAAIDAGLLDDSGQAEHGTLYTKDGINAIIEQLPHLKNQIICFAAALAAPQRQSDDTVLALLSCYEAWGGSFPAIEIHKGTIRIADYVRGSARQRDKGALGYMTEIDHCLQQARFEALERCISKLNVNEGYPKNILFVAERAVAPFFGRILAQQLKVQPTDIDYSD
jgi:hypothetical protein